MNILVTGHKGQLANEIYALAQSLSTQTTFFFKSENELDITDHQALRNTIKQHKIDRVINCAAYTNVDNAEDEQEKAFLINDTAVGNMAKIAKEHGAFLIHVSTDYVFDGRHYQPYNENDPTNPVSVYGKSKRAGELKIIENEAGIIIRTSWLYSATGKNFVKSIARLAEERDALKVVFDQVGNPTFAGDLAQTIIHITTQPKQELPHGVFHYSNEGVCSWYDFAMEITSMLNISCAITPIESKDFPTKAPRPHYSVLNKEKIKKTFNREIPYWKDSLWEMLKNFKS